MAVCFGAAVCVVPVGWEVLPTRAAEGHESADVFPATHDDNAGVGDFGVVVFADVGVTILAILDALRSIWGSNVFKQCELHLCNWVAKVKAYICPRKIVLLLLLSGKSFTRQKIRLRPSCRISASFVTLLVAK